MTDEELEELSRSENQHGNGTWAYQALVAEVRRLRALILEAERDGGPDVCCPWCGREPLNGMRHDGDCRAFSAPGVPR